MSGEDVVVVRSMLEAFNRGDPEGVLAAFDAGCEIREPLEMPDSPVMGYCGHDGVREWMGNLRGVAGAGFELRRFMPSGEVLLCELASKGLGQSSGVPVEWMTFAVIEMRGGRIARIRVFLSKNEAVQAVESSE